jgi:hypothetical protein
MAATDFQGLIARLRKQHGTSFTVINFGKRMTFVTEWQASVQTPWEGGEHLSANHTLISVKQ